MKKPERLMGFINYKEVDYPFELDKEEFILTLYPPTYDVWRKNSSFQEFHSNIEKRKNSKDWIPQINLNGTTSEGYQIIINVHDNNSNQFGFIMIRVNWYFIYTDKLDPDNIDGFQVIGHDLDLFYPPGIALEPKIEFDKNEKIRNFSISSTNNQKIESCGKYRVSTRIEAEMEISTITNLQYNLFKPSIDAKSTLKTIYSKPVDLKILVKARSNLLQLFAYVTYRQNIDVGDIEVLKINDKGMHTNEGILVFKNTLSKEINPKSKDRIINYHFLKDKVGQLFAMIKNSEIGLQHLCKSLDDILHYSPSRIIMILAEFENEFNNFYGQNYERSDNYLEVKKDVIKLIGEYSELETGDRKKYAKKLEISVSKFDHGFQKKTEIALLDNKSVMMSFIKLNGEEYEERIKELSISLGDIRNDIAHGRIGIDYSVNQLKDIWIMEKLLYCMCLKKKLHLDDNTCTKAIKKLFNG